MIEQFRPFFNAFFQRRTIRLIVVLFLIRILDAHEQCLRRVPPQKFRTGGKDLIRVNVADPLAMRRLHFPPQPQIEKTDTCRELLRQRQCLRMIVAFGAGCRHRIMGARQQ